MTFFKLFVVLGLLASPVVGFSVDDTFVTTPSSEPANKIDLPTKVDANNVQEPLNFSQPNTQPIRSDRYAPVIRSDMNKNPTILKDESSIKNETVTPSQDFNSAHDQGIFSTPDSK